MSTINNVGKFQNDKIGIEEFNADRQARYTVSIEEAHKLLLQAGVTKSKNEQVTMRWARDGEFDALLIGRGRVETRKWLINRESLMNFISYKNQTFFEYLEMKEELERLRAFKINVESTPVVEKKEPVKKETPQNKTSRKTTTKTPPQKKEEVATKVVEKK